MALAKFSIPKRVVPSLIWPFLTPVSSEGNLKPSLIILKRTVALVAWNPTHVVSKRGTLESSTLIPSDK